MKKEDLTKYLYKSIIKAINTPLEAKDVVKEIVKDIKDPNSIAEVPKEHIPASKQSVLQKRDLRKMLGTPMMTNEHEKGVDKLRKFMEKMKDKKNKKGK